MRIASVVHPANFLLCLCFVFSEGVYLYELYASFGSGLEPRTNVVIGAFCLFALGVVPFAVRDPARRAWTTAAAAVLAIPLARMWFGDLMHDLAILYPWLDHDRWCFPRSERTFTRESAPEFILLPIVVWACLMGWWHARSPRRAT